MTADIAIRREAFQGMTPVQAENAVTLLLEQARDQLALAVEYSGPAEVAQAKAKVATIAEMSKQLNLSKEIQLDSVEMVRRAEYALGKAIRKGQEEGSVLARGKSRTTFDRWSGVHRNTTNSTAVSVYSIAPHHELHGRDGSSGIYAMSDGIPEEQFEAALSDARAEGNVSRTNVVRKIKDTANPGTREQRAEKIAHLAAQGYASRQIAPIVGITERAVSDIARDFDIEIRADQFIKNTRRIDQDSVMENAIATVEHITQALAVIDASKITDPETQIDSLVRSINALRKAANRIKESL